MSRRISVVSSIVFLITVFCLNTAIQAQQSDSRLEQERANHNQGQDRASQNNVQTLHCPWYFVGEEFEAIVAMKNTTTQDLVVMMTLRYGSTTQEDGTYEVSNPIIIPAEQQQTISLRKIRSLATGSVRRAISGGIELTYFGEPDALMANTYISSARRRISFSIPFANPATAGSKTLHSVWWFNGPSYNSLVQMKNTTDEDVDVILTIRYGKGEAFDQPITIPAHQARAIDLNELKEFLNGAVSGSAEIRHSGPPGAIVANITSLSTMTGLVFDSPFTTRAQTRQK